MYIYEKEFKYTADLINAFEIGTKVYNTSDNEVYILAGTHSKTIAIVTDKNGTFHNIKSEYLHIVPMPKTEDGKYLVSAIDRWEEIRNALNITPMDGPLGFSEISALLILVIETLDKLHERYKEVEQAIYPWNLADKKW